MAKVLVVEDNDILNRAYRMILEKNEHDVQTATNGEEALEKIKDFTPHVILLDLLMPKMNGIDFLKHYDAPSHKDVKVVVLTNLGKEKEVKEAMSLGAHKYILKAQATPQDLANLVSRLISHNWAKAK